MNDRPRIRQSEYEHWCYLLFAIGILLASMLFSVSDKSTVSAGPLALPSLCAFKNAYGIDCPGCGLTRSFISMGHGQPIQAFHYNLGGPPLFLLLVVLVPYELIQIIRVRRGQPTLRFPRWLSWSFIALGAALIIQWVVRLLI